jgi:hypothetical protein
MFKWAKFLIIASAETSQLSSFEGENLLSQKNRQLKTAFYSIQGIISALFIYSFVHSLFVIGDFDDYQ